VYNVDTTSALDAIFILNLFYDVTNQFREFQDSEFVSISDIDWSSFVRVHEGDEAINQIVDVLEGACLLAIAVDGHVLTLESLDDEIGNDASIIRVHYYQKKKLVWSWDSGNKVLTPGTIGIENTRDPDIDTVLAVESIGQSLSNTFPFIIASARSDRVHMAPTNPK
jgi:hypothetical protein